MTDETPPQNPGPTPEPEPEMPPEPSPEPKRLTRSGSDALIGGVASGLGRYFGIDPILFRIGFVVVTFIGGAGLLAYLALLAFVPSDGESKPGGASKAAAVAGAVILGCLLVTFLSPPLFIFGPGLLVFGLIGLAGVLLWRALGGSTDGDAARTIGRLALAALIGVAVVGAALGVGLAAALGGGVVIAALAVVAGLALIGTAFVGGARWLIIPTLALVLPLGIVSAAGIELNGGVGDRDYRPTSVSQLRDHYEIGIGGLELDLRDVDLPPGRTDLRVDVGMGNALVYVPADACLTSDVQIGVGGSDVLDRHNDGVDVDYAAGGAASAGRPELHIDADVGIGVIEIAREGYAADSFGRDHFFRGNGRDRVFGPGDEVALEDFDGGTQCA